MHLKCFVSPGYGKQKQLSLLLRPKWVKMVLKQFKWNRAHTWINCAAEEPHEALGATASYQNSLLTVFHLRSPLLVDVCSSLHKNWNCFMVLIHNSHGYKGLVLIITAVGICSLQHREREKDKLATKPCTQQHQNAILISVTNILDRNKLLKIRRGSGTQRPSL